VPVIVADCEIMTPKAFPTKAAFVIANPKSKLLDQLREVLRVKHYSLRTEEAYGQWVRRYLKFHRDAKGTWIHPRELGPSDVVAFLNHLANGEHVAAGTQNQAVNANALLSAPVPGRTCGQLSAPPPPAQRFPPARFRRYGPKQLALARRWVRLLPGRAADSSAPHADVFARLAYDWIWPPM